VVTAEEVVSRAVVVEATMMMQETMTMKMTTEATVAETEGVKW
jgi:hypothetical protein